MHSKQLDQAFAPTALRHNRFDGATAGRVACCCFALYCEPRALALRADTPAFEREQRGTTALAASSTLSSESSSAHQAHSSCCYRLFSCLLLLLFWAVVAAAAAVDVEKLLVAEMRSVLEHLHLHRCWIQGLPVPAVRCHQWQAPVA